MGEGLTRQAKREAMRDIILKLHQGLSAAQAKERFEKEIGNISSTEVAELEQSLINEGLSPEEIKKFCNVHALIFQSALEKAASEETFPSHPVYLFKLENREIEKLVTLIKEMVAKKELVELVTLKTTIKELLLKLKGTDIHYERKEQVLFPFLERQGFMGPSKVMWGKDNEIRDLLRKALADLETISNKEEFEAYQQKTLDPLLQEVLGMIFKEENILLPTSLEKLKASDWVDILRESNDIGYVLIEKPGETAALLEELQGALFEEPAFQDNAVVLPTGTLKLPELMYLLNTLPADITFVDKDDTVRYFSGNKDMIFRRTKSVIGRKVQNCHPPQSVDAVEKILKSLKSGTKDYFDFWLNFKGKFVYIRYLAVRDRDRNYLGTLEVTQDITEIKKLEGERRLVDEGA